jgi:hypothetical protein
LNAIYEYQQIHGILLADAAKAFSDLNSHDILTPDSETINADGRGKALMSNRDKTFEEFGRAMQ